MTIQKDLNGSTLKISLEGRLDTNTSPMLENELKNDLTAVKELVFDMAGLAYISSAGLRVLLYAQKTMNAKQGTMVIHNVSESIMEIFEVTGFVDILNIA